LTRVHRTVEGDAFFPEFEDAFTLDSLVERNDDYTIERWLRK
ncbi:MAG: dihydrofolate reductase, partial [Verrucomicrobia bacterium]|nr:dihydrofolate reductase [Verrucomicrobiota bacterium]